MYNKIIIISDIHSNAKSLEITFDKIKDENFDLVVVLGDLLTYGANPNKTINLLKNFSRENECIFIRGNHDQFYFDIEDGLNPFKYKMPKFVKESIKWTKSRLKYNLKDCFEWRDSFKLKDIYFSHANPFNYGDWTYLNEINEIKRAMKRLKELNVKIGIFGHTHRINGFVFDTEIKHFSKIDTNIVINKNTDEIFLLNSGSIGQPRGEGLSFLKLNLSSRNIKSVHLNKALLKKHMSLKINATSLDKNTKVQILKFWEGNA